jgi:ApaG protein
MMASTLAVLFPYSAQTRDVIVRVSVSFLPEQSDPESRNWFWAYHIRLENVGEQDVQLLTRRWVIIDGRGARHLVEGEGVVGEQPVIVPGQSYDYVSGCPLDTPTGSMEGSYQMVDAEGTLFDVAIPRFSLVGPEVTE